MEIYEVDVAREFYIYPKKRVLMDLVPEKTNPINRLILKQRTTLIRRCIFNDT
jgi:hypothetical protein